MYRLEDYHRPTSAAEAMDLLMAPNRMVLAGGTTVRHDAGADPVELVDLQAIGLDRIVEDGDVIRIDAMVTLHDLVENQLIPDLIRTAARAELPSTLRTRATVGGTIGAVWSDSLLLTALLVHDASVLFVGGRLAPLQSVLSTGLVVGDLILAVEIQERGKTSLAQTGRTPGDEPIVAVAGRMTDDGIRLALCGIARTPQIVDAGDLEGIDPPGDFRGSAEYRRHLAKVLSARVIEELS